MASVVAQYFRTHGVNVVEGSLRAVEGKASSYVTADAQYRQHVIRPGWEALPVVIRMKMRGQYATWDQLYQTLREEAFETERGSVSLRLDAHSRVVRLVYEFFGEGEPPAEEEQTAAEPPLGMPVNGSAVSGDVPTARPVHAERGTPGTPPPTAEESPAAIGIDLGTTYSLVAYVDAQGRPCCIPNAAGDLLTPSVVLFEDEGSIVGKEALQGAILEPDRVAQLVKRDMGAKVYRKQINGEYLPPEVISSLILRSLKADAERRLGPVRKAVITVPAYFEETRRRATMDAGRLAGLEVLDIINEPTAAAIAYGYQLGFLDRKCQLNADHPLRVLVYDLGGGTFDVTIVEIQGTSFKALATDGDVCLGGKDWDGELIDLAAERFRQQFREDPRDNPVSLQELSQAAEAAKRTLTERQKASLLVNHLGSRVKVEVSRQEFEEATSALLERTRLTAELVVRQAGLTWEKIDRVLLVGGATRMPMVLRMLHELTGKEPDRSLSPDEAVAQGAALYAELLAPSEGKAVEASGFTLTNVNSHSLGVLGTDPKTGKRRNRILLPKNSPLPRTMTKTFKTYKANQHSVAITVLEGESKEPEACTKIGVCTIRDLPPDLPAGWPVQVTYTYEPNGRLHVSARVKGHSAGITTDFERENGMGDEDLDLWRGFISEETRELAG